MPSPIPIPATAQTLMQPTVFPPAGVRNTSPLLGGEPWTTEHVEPALATPLSTDVDDGLDAPEAFDDDLDEQEFVQATSMAPKASRVAAKSERRSLVPLLAVLALVVVAAGTMWLLVFRGGEGVATGTLIDDLPNAAEPAVADAEPVVEPAAEIPVVPEVVEEPATDELPEAVVAEDLTPVGADVPDAVVPDDVAPEVVAPDDAAEPAPDGLFGDLEVVAPEEEPAAEPVAETPPVEEPVAEAPPAAEPVVVAPPADGRVIEIASRIEPCKFGSRCLVAGFSLSGFETQPDSFVCEFASGARYTFPLKRSDVDYACATSGSGDSITIEIDGVRSETVVLD
jgi:hypothetical protein